jgi:hypothetical protein
LDRTGDVRENGIGFRANQSDGSDYQHQNYSQHYGVFRDILTLIFAAKPLHQFSHFSLAFGFAG